MSRYGNGGEIEKSFIVKHLGKTPSDESSLCKKHLIEAKRHHSIPNFIPKWRDQPLPKPVNKCAHPKCTNSQCDKLIKPAFARENLGVILQTLFISTGCDFISYFKSLGKATILNTFFQHAEFICGVNMPGCLHHTLEHNKSGGFLSFIRLVGTCYFKKHLAAFVSVYGHETPTHLYNSVDHSLQTQQKHEIWLQKIRKVVGERITN